jgi:hypothetical protein
MLYAPVNLLDPATTGRIALPRIGRYQNLNKVSPKDLAFHFEFGLLRDSKFIAPTTNGSAIGAQVAAESAFSALNPGP